MNTRFNTRGAFLVLARKCAYTVEHIKRRGTVYHAPFTLVSGRRKAAFATLNVKAANDHA